MDNGPMITNVQLAGDAGARSQSSAPQAPTPSPTGRRRKFAVPSIVYPTVTFVVILALIEAFVRVDHVKEYLLPLPTQVISTMVSKHSLLLSQGWVTLREILIGFAASIVVAIPLALAIVSSKTFEKSVFPLLVTSQVVPKVALAPLFLIWLGYGILPKIILVALLCFFPIVIDSVAGLRSIELEKIYLARSMGANPYQQFVKLRLPNALPYVFTGLKLAATFAVIGAVVSELIGASGGLGYLMVEAEGSLNTRIVFAAIGYLTIMGILMFSAVAFVERLAIPWHASRRGDSR